MPVTGITFALSNRLYVDVAQEKALLDRARQGQAQALDALVAANARPAHALAFRILRSREDAEEAVQDAFMKAFANLGSFRGQSRFSTWLHRIVYTTSLNRLAARRPAAHELDTQAEGHAALAGAARHGEALDADDRRRYTEQALGRLMPEERALVTLHYYEDLPLAEIAQITAQTPANVKIKLYRARKKLAAELQTLLGPELDLWKSHA